MEQQIREILAAYGRLGVDVDALDVNTDLYLNGMTSHASVNVMIGLEEAFDIEFPSEMLRKANFASIGAIQAALSELVPNSLAG